jgi:hypothetical protein
MKIPTPSRSSAEMLACARRELGLRKNVYPRWIEAGRMTEEKAKHEIECMESICTALEKLKMLEEITAEIKAGEKPKTKEEQADLDLERLGL